MTLHVSIDVDEPVHTGERFRVAVVIATTSPRTTRGVSLMLRGFTSLTTHAEREQRHVTFGTWTVPLTDGARLEVGSHRFEGTFLLPEDAPPCGDGIFEIVYQLDARVKMEVPWVFDATATRRIAVARLPRDERPPPRPVTVQSATRGRNALFLELSLDDVSFAPGESIEGAFSLANIGDGRVDAATVSLVPLLAGAIGGGDEASLFKSLVGIEEGGVVRFSFPLAATAALSFASRTLDVTQAIVLRVDGSPAVCRIPIVIDTFAARRGEPQAPPLLGSTRWHFAWRDEGARAGLTLEGRELSLRGTLAGAIEARVRPRGSGVRAKLAWESLGIGLSITPRVLLPGGISVDAIDPLFGQRFVARGYEPAQVLVALGPDLRDALLQFDEAELDDTGARVASTASARDPEELRRFLAALEALAEAVVAAERRLPPPSWVDDASAEAWRAFAAATTGRLHAGRMTVTGALVNGDSVNVATGSDANGRPRTTRITLVIDPPAESISHLPDGADADLIRSVQDRDLAPRVEIRPDAIVLQLDGATADPGSLHEPMAEMTKLARRLRGEMSRGPYR